MKIRIYYNKRRLKRKLSALCFIIGVVGMIYAGSSFEATGQIESILYAVGSLISLLIAVKLLNWEV